MKQQDLLAEDIKEEYRRLVREKEQLQTRCEKLELDLERRRKRVLDADLIRRGLQDFERLVVLLPLEDQKKLFQLLCAKWWFGLSSPTGRRPRSRQPRRTRWPGRGSSQQESALDGTACGSSSTGC